MTPDDAQQSTEQPILTEPLAAPHLSKEQVIASLTELGPLLHENPYTIEYGAWDGRFYDRPPAHSGPIDVWKIVVDVSRHHWPIATGGPGGKSSRVLREQARVIIVNDKEGRWELSASITD
jgi:hypothetical protein